MNEQSDSSVPPPAPVFCANGCGFYGSATTNNLCSKCFRESCTAGQTQSSPSGKSFALGQDSICPPSSSVAAFAKPGNRCDAESESNGPGPLPDGNTCHLLPSLCHSARPASVPVLSSNLDDAAAPPTLRPVKAARSEASVISSFGHHQPNVSDPPDSLSFNVGPVGCLSGLSPALSAVSAPPAADVSSSADSLSLLHGGGETASIPSSMESPQQVNKNRCWKCNRKIGLLGFPCRCGFVFCSSHRHADEHGCRFDYRNLGRQQLEKANQKVVADKLERL